MAKTLIWAVALVVSALILASGGIGAQRLTPILEDDDDGAGMTPKPVEVVNFPATQKVRVRNFLLVQEGVGTVDLGNFSAPQVRFVGVTTATFQQDTTVINQSRACDLEFPGSRICQTKEIAKSIPAPAEWMGSVRLVDDLDRLNFDTTKGCMDADGISVSCKAFPSDPNIHPIACCGF